MNINEIITKFKSLGVKGIIVFAILIVINASLVNLDAGRYMMEQTPSGKLIPHMTPGYKIITPFVTDIKFYNEVTTITYDEREGQATSANPPYPITFADTYSGNIKGSFRIELPKDPEKFILLHKAFKRYDNFVDNGIEKFTNELLTYTANQYTGEAFMQGGQNEYKTRLFDQATKGLYVTKRIAVKVDRQVGSVSLTNDKPGKTSDSKQTVFRNVIQRDNNGKPLREANPMAKYGVKVTQVTVDGFLPEPALKAFMQNKKDMIQKRQKLIENQENEKQAAITAKLKGDRERVEAKQKMLREKDAAVIDANKNVELARLQATREKVDRQKIADLAVIDKTKDLQVAVAEFKIQEANAKSAKEKAIAIKSVGLAEADVKKAMYNAVKKEILELEVQKITQLAKYKALGTAKITMPQTVMMGNSNDGGSLQDLTNLHIMDKLK